MAEFELAVGIEKHHILDEDDRLEEFCLKSVAIRPPLDASLKQRVNHNLRSIPIEDYPDCTEIIFDEGRAKVSGQRLMGVVAKILINHGHSVSFINEEVEIEDADSVFEHLELAYEQPRAA